MINPYYVTIIAIYVIALFIISAFARRRNKTNTDYLISGRSIGSLNAAISAGASDMSGWLLLGLPGAVYVFGINQSWIAIGLVIGAYLNWHFIAGRLRKASETYNIATMPDFFSEVVGGNSPAIRILAGVIILVFFTIYVASGFVAGAKVFHHYFGFSYLTSVIVTFLIISIYTSIGGLLAINWTDLLNGTIMICVLFGLPLATYFLIKHHNINIVHNALAYNPNALNIFHNTSLLGIISLLAWGLGYFGQPHILNQFMAMRAPELAKRARTIGISWMVLGLLFAIVVGFLGSAYFASTPLKDPESVMIYLSGLFSPIFTGFVLVAVLAAVMSTASAQLLIVSAVFTNDLKIVKKQIIFNKILIIIVGIIAAYIASNPSSKILDMVGYAWAGFGASFGPLIICSLFFKRFITSQGAFSGIIVGGLTVVIWKYLQGMHIYTIFSLYEILPGFIFSMLSIFIVSALTIKKSQRAETAGNSLS